jgi:hypothetical protein
MPASNNRRNPAERQHNHMIRVNPMVSFQTFDTNAPETFSDMQERSMSGEWLSNDHSAHFLHHYPAGEKYVNHHGKPHSEHHLPASCDSP